MTAKDVLTVSDEQLKTLSDGGVTVIELDEAEDDDEDEFIVIAHEEHQETIEAVFEGVAQQ